MEKRLPNKDSSGEGSGDLATYSIVGSEAEKLCQFFHVSSSLSEKRGCVFFYFSLCDLGTILIPCIEGSLILKSWFRFGKKNLVIKN